MSDTVDERADTLLSAPPADETTPPRRRFPPEERTTGELARALEYVEQKVERNFREINGTGGRDTGLRGALQRIDLRMETYDKDLDAYRRESSERTEALAALMRSEHEKLSLKLEAKINELSAKVDGRRMPMWLVAVLVLCALTVTALQVYVVLVPN